MRSPAALEIREQGLTHRRVLGRPFPTARARVSGHPRRSRAPPRGSARQCAPRRGSAQRVQGRRAAPIARAPQLRRGLGDEPPAHACSCSCPDSRHRRGTGSRLRAYWRVATPTSIWSTTRRFNGSVCASPWNVGSGNLTPRRRARAGRCTGHLASAQHDFAGHRASTGTRHALADAHTEGPHSAVRSSSSIASSTRRPERTINSNSSGFRVDQEFNERQGPDGGRFNSSNRTGYARLLHGGSLLAGLRPGLVTTRVPRAVEEPPLSNFNSQWDIPSLAREPDRSR